MTKLKDIATTAGVSISTVSKALNNSREINKETKTRIIRVARELNYNMSALHGETSVNKSQTIGVICPEINSNYYTQLISSIGRQITKKGYSYTIAVSDFDRKKEEELLEVFGGQNVGGIILITESTDIHSVVSGVKDIWHTPLLLIASEDDVNDYDCIQIDDYYGVVTGVSYLIRLGHKRIAYIGDSLTEGRLRAYRDTLEKHNLTVDESLIRTAEQRFEKGGYQSMLSLLKGNLHPTAVFAAYDDMAIGAMRAITEMGHGVPEDISVIGMDDVFVSPYLSRALTTVSNPIKEMAMVSISILTRKIEDSKFTVVQNVVLKPSLIIRETTAELN
ncbi:MAG: LacI family DNA-binding transcriptional regulator [Bacillota bacterium]|nr:LacI family DNA-binding transcriptional regulator [Bacillota bacterium]